MKKTYHLNILVALPCEADPLITFFQLKKIVRQSTPFIIFENKSHNIQLVISGVGRINMAAAVTYLHMLMGQQASSCYLNIGIAGSISHEIGKAVLINKVTDTSTSRSWYPFTALFKHPLQGTLYTYDHPQTSYPHAGLVDMEGSAFFQAASRFISQEQIQIIKITSDYDNTSQQNLTPAKVISLIKENLSHIKNMTDCLINLSKQESNLEFNYDELDNFKKTWHFTHSQELELKNCLQRWQNLKMEPTWALFQEEKNAGNVIQKIKIMLEKNIATIGMT